jgi:pentose-5-phosphate-3-epimerase
MARAPHPANRRGRPEDASLFPERFAPNVDVVLLLSIARRGLLGQPFDYRALDVLAAINRFATRRQFDVCVDGGVNEFVIGLLNAERVVSGSSVLGAVDPRRQIMRLQTSSQYERV